MANAAPIEHKPRHQILMQHTHSPNISNTMFLALPIAHPRHRCHQQNASDDELLPLFPNATQQKKRWKVAWIMKPGPKNAAKRFLFKWCDQSYICGHRSNEAMVWVDGSLVAELKCIYGKLLFKRTFDLCCWQNEIRCISWSHKVMIDSINFEIIIV